MATKYNVGQYRWVLKAFRMNFPSFLYFYREEKPFITIFFLF